MTLPQFFSILRARWKAMAVILGLAVLGTALVNYLLPRSYTSTAAVLVDVKTPDPIAGIVFPGMTSPSYMATQVDVIQSDRVSQQVVRALRLDESEPMREKWREGTKGVGNFQIWLADVLRKSLDVKPSRESNVITVAYKSADPKFASALANAYAQAYIDVSLELRVEPAKQYGRFFDERAKQLRAKVEAARAKVSAFQKEKGLVGADERLDVENARLNELSTQYVSLQAVSAESTGRQAQVRNSSEQLQDVITNPVIGNLKYDLARQESRLKELRERLGDNHPNVRETQAAVDETKQRLAAETARVSGGVGVTNAINQSRLDKVRASLDAQRLKVLKLKDARDGLSVLVSDLDSAQRAYDAVIARSNQTELESRTTQTNVYVLNPASEPTLPASPRVTLNMLLALFIGTLLAVGAAMLMELFDRRVRSAGEVVQLLDIPLLGILSRRPRGKLFGKKEAPAVASPAAPSLAAEPVLPSVGLALAESAAPVSASSAPAANDGIGHSVHDRVLGDIFRDTHKLTAAQIEQILKHQTEHKLLFGEAAMALGLVEGNDLMWALSQQFHYPYAGAGRKHFNTELVVATKPFSDISETFRGIRSQLIRRVANMPQRRAIAVVSADEDDGKSFVAANLAIAFSQLGRRTLLIDANMRKPRMHRVFGIEGGAGLSNILSGRMAQRVLSPVTDLPSLFVLPGGTVPPNPLELLESPAFGLLIGELLGKFDHVVVDTPSAMVGADAGVVCGRSGSFLAVARQGRTRMDSMQELVRSLRDATTEPLGFIVNEH
jgi:polysaccharide biosynthesis transport protein